MPRSGAADLDAADPLAGFRDRFAPLEPGLIYLDGNSLGMLPAATAQRLAEVIREDWGTGLIRSWGHWMDLPGQVGDLLGEHLLGAGPGQVTVCDSTTVNLYKLAWAALDARPGRPVLVTDDDNFPTDRYVLAGIAARSGGQLRMIRTDPDEGIRRRTTSAPPSGRTPRWSASRTWPTGAGRWPTWPRSPGSRTRRGRWCSGTCATPPARSRWTWTAAPPTWRWAARTST